MTFQSHKYGEHELRSLRRRLRAQGQDRQLQRRPVPPKVLRVRPMLQAVSGRRLLRVRGPEVLRTRLSRPLRSVLRKMRRIHRRQGHQGHERHLAPAMLHLRNVQKGVGRFGLRQESGPEFVSRVQRQGQGAGRGQVHVPKVSLGHRRRAVEIQGRGLPSLSL